MCLSAGAAEVRFDPFDVKTVFAIGKSDDGNQVQYALKLNSACHPVGNQPTFGYWREYDRHERLLPMGLLDQIGYGIAHQKVTGQHVFIALNPAAGREIEIIAAANADGTCHAAAFTTISGKRARLTLIFLQLSGPLSVKWVELRGVDDETGAALVERVKP